MIPLTWTDSFQIQKSLVSKISENPKRSPLLSVCTLNDIQKVGIKEKFDLSYKNYTRNATCGS